MKRSWSSAPILLAALVLLSSCAPQTVTVTAAAFDFMDTVSVVTLYERDADAAEKVFEACRALDDLVDMRDPSSEIARLNASNGERTVISPDTEALLRAGVDAARVSDGLFDVTIGSVSALWDFVNGVAPDESTLADALSRVGIGNLTVGDGYASIINGGIADLGGLTKGYALDVVDELLAEQGVANALVNLGGSVLAIGSRPDGKQWRAGIQKPFGDADDLLGVITGDSIKIVTAGLYQRSFENDGRLYHHILDPRTGTPVETDVWSATIIADSGVWADAYSTMCVLFGSARALDFVNALDDVECVLALSDGSTLISDGIASGEAGIAFAASAE
ncbi:MAG: FAD:protein FMN transferase [Oscillospiraceae bacterium]|nr:FAD:protein FMN transferase [Oscillospiraceae bacterium]